MLSIIPQNSQGSTLYSLGCLRSLMPCHVRFKAEPRNRPPGFIILLFYNPDKIYGSNYMRCVPQSTGAVSSQVDVKDSSGFQWNCTKSLKVQRHLKHQIFFPPARLLHQTLPVHCLGSACAKLLSYNVIQAWWKRCKAAALSWSRDKYAAAWHDLLTSQIVHFSP